MSGMGDRCEQDEDLWFLSLKSGFQMLRAWTLRGKETASGNHFVKGPRGEEAAEVITVGCPTLHSK